MCEQQIEIFTKKVTEIIRAENNKLISELEKHNSELLSYYKNKSHIDDLIVIYDLADGVISNLKPLLNSENLNSSEFRDLPLKNNFSTKQNDEVRLRTLTDDRSNKNIVVNSNPLSNGIYQDLLELKESTERILNKNFVSPLNTIIGSKFDPKLHRVIESREAPNDRDKNTLSRIIKEGFIYENPDTNEKLVIRPSWIEIYK